jgi:hypothetical protein
MVALSTTQVAEILGDAFARPSISPKIVKTLVEAGAFTDIGPGRSIRIDSSEVDDFVARTRPVKREDWPAHWPIFRVSLLGLHDDPIHDATGALLRRHAGADYRGRSGLSAANLELAWTGVWAVSDATAEEAVTREAILTGTTKGYISPRYVGQIVGFRRDWQSGRIWWETKPAPDQIRAFVGTGLWMPVKPGRESDWA